MKIAIIGTGYVGLITGLCLAQKGHEVICVDKDSEKIEKLRKGIAPFFEPGLEELMAEVDVKFDEDFEKADIVMCCVGTPSDENGDVDLSAVQSVIDEHAEKGEFFVMKSTVPVGTCTEEMIMNPEFLRQGSAIKDTMEPDRIVVGASSPEDFEVMRDLYSDFDAPIIETDLMTAELSKYAANCYLATKISFINEFANYCENTGADFAKLQESLKYDTRIGPEFLEPGVGFGGSCLPKDLKAMIQRADVDDFKVLKAADEANQIQKQRIVEKLKSEIDLKGRKVGILGLSFKPNTDDMRDAPSLDVIARLKEEGCDVHCYDPKAKSEHNNCKDPYEVCENSDALLVLTEWEEFGLLDLEKARELMKNGILIDGRNVFKAEEARKAGFIYHGVGLS
ncbi:UDP-glucose dehydrogenase family protein [Patescibacteria group bacterium]